MRLVEKITKSESMTDTLERVKACMEKPHLQKFASNGKKYLTSVAFIYLNNRRKCTNYYAHYGR